jgi:aminopeptidase
MYSPPKEILEKYADVLINCALNSGEGIKEGEVVFLQVGECAKPLLVELFKATLKAKAHPLVQYIPDDFSKLYYENANQKQLEFFPSDYLKGKVNQADHFVMIIAETDLHELESIPPEKIMTKGKSMKPYMDWRRDKENKGEMTWTLAMYGTEAMAKEANMPIEEYWEQIIEACYLNEENPVEKWKSILNKIEETKVRLDALEIEKIHVKGQNIDLVVGLGKNRKWMGGSGRNIPSFELFISPDWRKTEGKIKFSEPLYRYGNLIENIELEFKDGVVINSSASKGESILKEMILVENADKIGEFSLTDSRMSKITKFMADTLFDENVGGEFGNTHIALGSAYKDSYTGDPSIPSEKEWEEMGYNDSVIHTDIVSTEDRVVTATLPDGTEKIIYKNGKFTLD